MEVNKLALRIAVLTAVIHGIKRSFRSARIEDEGGSLSTNSSFFTLKVLGVRFKVIIKQVS